ncbi:Sensory transduction histidine kinase [Oceanicola granulosus HTCC2516]|uniref:histidine kinase n=1 Tax=Oceanicola granulosus (strain ATCC BAA-861 / DSM 15982 / KCTC 12143 / HTCC2516) TaxID=314256 RepID=Q2CGE4_OCEGH|nr:ATP-binding protein [Oceanicola granulosus]EAR51774.1 Sensory transduction histidine kinase [Oceanicola granulosus HTCC2516]
MVDENIQDRPVDENHRLLKNLRDYARAVQTLTWQRQGIFAAVAVLTGSFFSPWKAALFFAVCMFCEFVDLRLSRRVAKIADGDYATTRRLYPFYIANTVASGLAIGIYAVWVGITGDGAGMFTALFCLFAAALYASINNHQIASALAIRLTLYGGSFLVITVRDLYVYRPPLSSDMWLQFFTVIFVMYFLIDCSLGFLRMYRHDLKQLENLEREHERAKAALVLRTQFVAIVSHELRTPLTSIKGSLDLINSGRFGDFPPQAKSLLQMIDRNSRRLADLVDDLLDLQKLEEGRMTFEKKTIDIRTFIADALTSHEGLAKRYDVRLNVKVDCANPVYVHTDPSRLMQVLGNIISNAAKFSPENGDVDIWLDVENGRVRVYVRDRGVGIPPGQKEAVFGRFTQIDASDQRKFGGTGLGMNISREIIEAIGGTIDYESEVGKGTTFVIELPCAVVLDQASDDEETSLCDDAASEEALPATVRA